MKPIYDMTPLELMEAIELAEANGDEQRARELQAALDLIYRTADAFKKGTDGL